MGALFHNVLGGQRGARLVDVVEVLHENVKGVQRLFVDTIKKQKTVNPQTKRSRVVQENWDKSRTRKKINSYQKGSKRSDTINVIRNQLRKLM